MLGKLLKLWPGLEYLIRHGSFRAWLAAMFYALFALAVLCATLLWDEILAPGPRTVLLILFVVVWTVGLIVSQRFETAYLQEQAQRRKDAVVLDTLPLAQTEFLQQNFFEAERLLRERLERFPEDVATRFFLISVLKSQRRIEEARKQLDILEENPQLGLWRLDLPHEREVLK